MSGYKAIFWVLLCAAGILLFLCRHYPGRAAADYIQRNVSAMAPELDLDISAPGLCVPLGLGADTIRVSLKKQPACPPFQVTLNRFKSVLKIKPLWDRHLEISFSAGMWQGRLSGLARARDLGFNHITIASRFTGLDPEDILSALDIPGLSCTGPVNGTIHTTITGGRVEEWKADITADHIHLEWARAIPMLGDTAFSTATISGERTGRGPIRITAGKILGKHAEIQLSGHISPAVPFMASRLDLAVEILGRHRETEHRHGPGHPNPSPGAHAVQLTLTGSVDNPALKLTGLSAPLSGDAPSADGTGEPVQTKKRPPAASQSTAGASPQRDTRKTNAGTALGLRLLGTVTGTGIEPMAVIRKKAGRLERLYAPGDIVDRAEILRIMRRQVVLRVDGKQALLSMENPGTADGRSASGTRSGSFSGEIPLTRKDVNGIINNIADLTGQIRIKPHSQGDQIDGYRISGLGKNSILHKKLGLRQGDIVTEINGQPLDSPDNFAALYNQFLRGTLDRTIDIGIQRNGKPGILSYRIK